MWERGVGTQWGLGFIFSETSVHYVINLPAAAWKARSDGPSLMQRARAIYHGGRRMTPSLSTPLTFINGPLKDSQTQTPKHTHTHAQSKDLWLDGKTLKRQHSISRDTGAFWYSSHGSAPARLAIDKEPLTVSAVRKDNSKMSRIQANSILRATCVSLLILPMAPKVKTSLAAVFFFGWHFGIWGAVEMSVNSMEQLGRF